MLNKAQGKYTGEMEHGGEDSVCGAGVGLASRGRISGIPGDGGLKIRILTEGYRSFSRHGICRVEATDSVSTSAGFSPKTALAPGSRE